MVSSQSNHSMILRASHVLAFTSISLCLGSYLVQLNTCTNNNNNTTVSLQDIKLVLIYPLYLWLVQSLCFPVKRLSTSKKSLSIDGNGKTHPTASVQYMATFIILAILIPYKTTVNYIERHSSSDSEKTTAAVVPLVILFAQIFHKFVSVTTATRKQEKERLYYNDVMLIWIPIGLNALLYEWYIMSSYMTGVGAEGSSGIGMLLSMSVLNMSMWLYNILVFLMLHHAYVSESVSEERKCESEAKLECIMLLYKFSLQTFINDMKERILQ